MTKTEFDDFLEPLGLINAYDNSPIPFASYFAIGEGWYEITADLITDLIAMGWDKRLFQVKEKFGGGRFYIGEGGDMINKRISIWENETFATCEKCGTEENVSKAGPRWRRTLCDSCRAKIKPIA